MLTIEKYSIQEEFYAHFVSINLIQYTSTNEYIGPITYKVLKRTFS